MYEEHQVFLKRALQLAQQRKGYCAPNPAVGAVIVKQGKVISSGFHWASGYPHAEVAAIMGLTPKDTAGATLYVTLEPCCHWGKTAPCTDLIMQYRFAKVFFGMRDPNPAVAGKGQTSLQQAAIVCEFLPLPEIDAFYESYKFWWQNHRPLVIAKLAMSLDAKIAGKNGQPVAITVSELSKFTHLRRNYADAILTTALTIERDDPQLNVRLEEDTFSKPIYVLDSELRIPLTAKIFTTASKITLFHAPQASLQRKEALQALGILLHEIPQVTAGCLNLRRVVDKIGEEGIHELWVEAGGRCFTSFLREKLLQRAYIYVAPKCLGSEAWPAFTEILDVFSGAKDYNCRIVGQDAICEINYS